MSPEFPDERTNPPLDNSGRARAGPRNTGSSSRPGFQFRAGVIVRAAVRRRSPQDEIPAAVALSESETLQTARSYFFQGPNGRRREGASLRDRPQAFFAFPVRRRDRAQSYPYSRPAERAA